MNFWKIGMKKILWSMTFCLLVSCSKDVSLKSNFPRLRIDPVLKDQKMSIDKEFQEKNISGKKIKFEGNFKDHQLIAEVMTDIEPERAAILMKNKAMMIKGFYLNQGVALTGSTNEEAGCVAELQLDPHLQDNKIQISMQFNLKATARLIAGVCDEEQNVFRSQSLLLYCKNDKMFYDLKYYYPKNNKPITAPIASCTK